MGVSSTSVCGDGLASAAPFAMRALAACADTAKPFLGSITGMPRRTFGFVGVCLRSSLGLKSMPAFNAAWLMTEVGRSASAISSAYQALFLSGLGVRTRCIDYQHTKSLYFRSLQLTFFDSGVLIARHLRFGEGLSSPGYRKGPFRLAGYDNALPFPCPRVDRFEVGKFCLTCWVCAAGSGIPPSLACDGVQGRDSCGI